MTLIFKTQVTFKSSNKHLFNQQHNISRFYTRNRRSVKLTPPVRITNRYSLRVTYMFLLVYPTHIWTEVIIYTNISCIRNSPITTFCNCFKHILNNIGKSHLSKFLVKLCIRTIDGVLNVSLCSYSMKISKTLIPSMK